jgi:nucleoside-diphosphate kinase
VKNPLRLLQLEDNPVDAELGTIRKDFAVNMQRNSVHGSDSAETAKREIALCFKKGEIVG